MVLSAGTLLYRWATGELEVLIAHMGGPFWARKDDHAWSIPKGEYDSGESAVGAAAREFAEEMGHRCRTAMSLRSVSSGCRVASG